MECCENQKNLIFNRTWPNLNANRILALLTNLVNIEGKVIVLHVKRVLIQFFHLDIPFNQPVVLQVNN